jgi:hypothetical protein
MRRVLLGAAGVLVVLATSVRTGSAQKPPVEQVLASLDGYFDSYRLALGELVAEERMVQRTGGRDLNSPNAVKPIEITREILSDVAFIDLPGGAGWMGFRETKTVSGRIQPRRGPSRLEALAMGGASGREQARALLQASTTHNLGEPRTTNLPNLPLEILQQRNRERFRILIEDTDRIKGHDTAVLLLEETRTPTLIQRPQGGDIFTVVRAWVEPATGRLWRAHVRLVDGRVRAGGIKALPATVDVHFVEHPALGLLVPDRMEEEFFAQGRGPGRGDARYTNYRRFTTAARLVPP